MRTKRTVVFERAAIKGVVVESQAQFVMTTFEPFKVLDSTTTPLIGFEHCRTRI